MENRLSFKLENSRQDAKRAKFLKVSFADFASSMIKKDAGIRLRNGEKAVAKNGNCVFWHNGEYPGTRCAMVLETDAKL